MSHWFSLNNDPKAECSNIDGLMDAYHTSLHSVTLNGPTYAAPCIKQLINYVSSRSTSKIYQIMLILTDGKLYNIIIDDWFP